MKQLLNEEFYKNACKEVKDAVFNKSNILEVCFVFDEKHHVVQKVGRALASLILLEPMRGRVELDQTILFSTEPLPENVSKYYDFFIRKFKETLPLKDYEDFKFRIAEAIQNLCECTSKFNRIVGNSSTLLDILDVMDDDPEFKELVYFEIPPNLQFNEIEELIQGTLNRAVEILKARTGSVMANYLGCKSIINEKQFGQSIVCVGLKPSLQGQVLPEPVNTNFLRGLRHQRDYYISALGCRKALITNHKQVKKSGYLARKIALLTIDQKQDPHLEDCGSLHGVIVNVTDNKVLKRLDGRFGYKESDEEGGDAVEFIVNSANDSHLIGDSVFIRSPITCSSKKICQKCFGLTYKDNVDYNVGLVATLLLTSQITQLLLSTKHLLQTNSDTIDWPDTFSDFFSIDKSMIIAGSRVKKIIISKDDIIEDDDSDVPYVRSFSIVNSVTDGVMYFELPVNFYLSEYACKGLDSSNDTVELDPTKRDGEFDFFISLENNEISASLEQILALISVNNNYTQDDIDNILNEFLRLLNESNIRIQSNHVETIIRSLIWTKDKEKPDFNSEEMPDFDIIKLGDSILNGPLAVSLVFEHIKRQFNDPYTFEKSAASVLDQLYK
jgi:hypothetical protein